MKGPGSGLSCLSVVLVFGQLLCFLPELTPSPGWTGHGLFIRVQRNRNLFVLESGGDRQTHKSHDNSCFLFEVTYKVTTLWKFYSLKLKHWNVLNEVIHKSSCMSFIYILCIAIENDLRGSKMYKSKNFSFNTYWLNPLTARSLFSLETPVHLFCSTCLLRSLFF